MPATTHIHVRGARDRLIDLLGFGETYPLRDLAVRDERLTVPFDTAAKIPIDISQLDVKYSLHFKDGRAVKRSATKPIAALGNGETLQLETPPIEEDITYKIKATKIESKRDAYLHQTATVKVGLDVTLEAWILHAPLLDPDIDLPTKTDPRIVDYGTTVEVEIKKSQEGVDYQLIGFKTAPTVPDNSGVELSTAKVRGNRDNIILVTQPVFEDIYIGIKASKTFDPSENRKNQEAFLDVVLPLKVRANPSLPVAVVPSPIIAYGQGATLRIAATQESAVYRLYFRAIADRDFVHGAANASDVLKAPVLSEPDVQVVKPGRPEIWQEPDGYAPLAESLPGSGGDLDFNIKSLTEDSLIIIQALKNHEVKKNGQAVKIIASAVQLATAALVLVRPDPAPRLRLTVPIQGDKTSGTIRVENGQPGVFYFFRRTPQGKDFNLPVYFHKRDDHDESQNKGLNQLKLNIDFVVVVDPPAGSVGETDDPAKIFPQPPILETGPLKTGSTLYIRAVKAQTRVKTPLDPSAQIEALPEIRPEQDTVAPGGTARILVIASKEGDRYQLTLNGEPVKKARNGNGTDLVFITEPISEDTTFEMIITRPQEEGIAVERVVRLPVTVVTNA